MKPSNSSKSTNKRQYILLKLADFSKRHVAVFAVVFGAIGGIFLLSNSSAVRPVPSVYLNPETKSVAQNAEFSVEVRMDSGSTTVNAVQADFTYPADLVDFVGIDATGSAFTTEAPSTGGNGKVSIARGVITAVSGDKLVAIVKFKAKAVDSKAKFTFAPGTALLNSTTNVNILSSLDKAIGAEYQIGSGGATPNPTPPPTSAAKAYLAPAAKTVAPGTAFSVEVRVDSATAMVNAVQADLTYPADLIEFVGIDAANSAFTTAAPASGGNGKVSIARGTITAVSGDKLVAVINFKSKATVGTAAIAFTVDTALLDSTSNTNILTGSGSKVGGSYTIANATTPPPPPPPPSQGSARMYLSPATRSLAANTAFSVEVRADSGSELVNAVQADFSYPANLVDFVSISGTGSAYTTEAPSTGGNGKVSIARGVIGGVTGDKLVAIVNFKTKATAGTATMAFVADTGLISATTNVDILGSLSKTAGGSYAISSTSTPPPNPPTPTPTPTPPNPPTPTPTPPNTPPSPPPAPPKRGDIDGDGKVNLEDLTMFLLRWGTTDVKADFDGDGKVTIYDLSILLSNYGG